MDSDGIDQEYEAFCELAVKAFEDAAKKMSIKPYDLIGAFQNGELAELIEACRDLSFCPTCPDTYWDKGEHGPDCILAKIPTT